MFMDTGLVSTLRKLKLTETAKDVLSVMCERQEPGGAVLMTQPQIACELGIHKSQVSRAMAQLVERGLVQRPNNGRGRSYSLNPAIAGYESEEDMARAMTEAISAGGPPPILIPDYQHTPPKPGRAQLSSVA